MSTKKKGARKKEVEPRVLTSDVQGVLLRVTSVGHDTQGAVKLLAYKADTSTRTVYRVLEGTTDSMNIDLADRLCIAADAHLSECRLVWPDGSVTSYF